VFDRVLFFSLFPPSQRKPAFSFFSQFYEGNRTFPSPPCIIRLADFWFSAPRVFHGFFFVLRNCFFLFPFLRVGELRAPSFLFCPTGQRVSAPFGQEDDDLSFFLSVVGGPLASFFLPARTRFFPLPLELPEPSGVSFFSARTSVVFFSFSFLCRRSSLACCFFLFPPCRRALAVLSVSLLFLSVGGVLIFSYFFFLKKIRIFFFLCRRSVGVWPGQEFGWFLPPSSFSSLDFLFFFEGRPSFVFLPP